MAEAEEMPMTIDRGSTWFRLVQIRDNAGEAIDLSDVVFEGTVRKRYAVNPKPMALFSFEPVTDWTDGDFNLVLSGSNSLVLNPRFLYEYDIWAVGIGEWKRRLIFGTIDLRNYVTPQS